MSSVRVSGVLVGLLLTLSVSVSGAGATSALLPKDAKADQTVSCYRELREALGTVLPSGYQGYRNAAVCAQVLSGGNSHAVSAPANRAPADARSCYFTMRQELGTVLPGRGADFFARACSSGLVAQKP